MVVITLKVLIMVAAVAAALVKLVLFQIMITVPMEEMEQHFQ